MNRTCKFANCAHAAVDDRTACTEHFKAYAELVKWSHTEWNLNPFYSEFSARYSADYPARTVYAEVDQRWYRYEDFRATAEQILLGIFREASEHQLASRM